MWPVLLLAQALPRPQLIFPSKTWFFRIYLNFQHQKSLENQYLPHFSIQILPNKIPLNPTHQDLSNNIKGTFQFLLQNFQLWFNLILSEEIIQYSKNFRFASPNRHGPHQVNHSFYNLNYLNQPRTASSTFLFLLWDFVFVDCSWLQCKGVECFIHSDNNHMEEGRVH